MRRLLGLCALLVSLVGTAAQAEPAAVLHFGLLAVRSADQVEADWAPVLGALERRLGVKVIPHVSHDYAGVVWALREGRDQLAWLGNLSAIEAVDKAGCHVFARKVYPSGVSGYSSLLITAAGSKLASLDDVFARAGDLTYGRGDTNSTSGTLMPSYYLFSARQVEPHRIFKRVVRASHEENVRAVLDGRVDVASVASDLLDTIARDGKGGVRSLRVLWRSPLIPGDPLVWRNDLSEGLKRQVREFFLDYGVESRGKAAGRLAEEQAHLARLNILRFDASDDGQLLPVRRVELFKDRLQIEASGDLTAEERGRRLDDIDGRLAALSDRGRQ